MADRAFDKVISANRWTEFFEHNFTLRTTVDIQRHGIHTLMNNRHILIDGIILRNVCQTAANTICGSLTAAIACILMLFWLSFVEVLRCCLLMLI